ncbi:hypothetical protein, partial [Vibrio campbellii]|uniref:hypothetical protein n=1 Tax=Vibrio campbellii TaxID=680 RepID=UPI00142E1FE9
DDLSALNQPSSSWASITNTSDLTSHVGQYVVLVLSYDDTVDALTVTVASDAPVQSVATPTEFAAWYSVIDLSNLTANDEATLASTPSLVAANNSETQGPGTGYTVTYRYYSQQAPSVAFMDLMSLASQYPATVSIKVEATQDSTNTNASRTLTENFAFVGDDAYEIFSVSQPVLRYDTPLLMTDSISLQNQSVVVNEVNALMSSFSIDVTYQWEKSTSGGATWVEVVPVSAGYFDLMGPLELGAQYQLVLISENRSTGVTTRFASTPSIAVTNSGDDYDIVFDPLTTPQEGIPLRVVSTLQSSGTDISFDARVVTWTLIAPDGSQGTPLVADTVTPTALDVGSYYEVTVAYERSGSVLVSDTFFSAPVIAAPTSTDLTDLAGVLNLALTPNGVSVGT